MTNFECLSCLLALPVGTVEMTNFECVLCSFSSVQFPMSFFSVKSLEGDGAQVVGSAIHGTIKLLNGEAALELFAWIILALVSRCQLCSRHTHHWLHFCERVLMFCHEPQGYYDAFARFPGRLLCGAERGCSLSEGTARAEVFCAFHFIVELSGRGCCVSIIAGPGVTCKLARHMTAASILRYFRSMPQVVRRAAALGCCAGQRRCVPFLVEGHCGELARHKPRSCFFVRFCWRFLLLLISLLCCLFCVVSR